MLRQQWKVSQLLSSQLPLCLQTYAEPKASQVAFNAVQDQESRHPSIRCECKSVTIFLVIAKQRVRQALNALIGCRRLLHWQGLLHFDWHTTAVLEGCCCVALQFPLKGILQEAVKKTQYNRLKDGQVGAGQGVSSCLQDQELHLQLAGF